MGKVMLSMRFSHGTQCRRPVSGFTLVEMITAIAVLAIAAAIAVPSFREMGINMNVTDTTNDLVGAMTLARSEAVKRGRPVAVIANGGTWTDGWQVVAAEESAPGVIEDPPVSPGASSDECREYLDLDGESQLCVRHRDPVAPDYVVASTADALIFEIGGTLRGGAAVTLNVCRPDGILARGRQVIVAGSGIVTTQAGAGSCS